MTAFRSAGEAHPWLLLREVDDFGLPAYDLLRPPARFWADDADRAPPAWRNGVDAQRVEPEPLPTALLHALPPGDVWIAMSRRSRRRLFAWFLVAEDPHHRLDVQPVATLAHQVSLVHHILREPHLQSVLIGDEVGLGKTVEAGLLVQALLREQPGLRVLYLAPARLVANVRSELDRLGLAFRSWAAGGEADARLDDPLVIASIHRAVFPAHFERIVDGPRWDVIIVDECHHLSAYGAEGQGAVRKYRLVDRLRKALRPTGRLVLMSGTPHQGNAERFDNLLRLLRRDGETRTDVAGRVIYRTKEDIRGWNGQRLFPSRDVRPPIILDLGPAHRAWLATVHHLFARRAPDDEAGEPAHDANARRVSDWRCAQALQWATSSIEAGLGYLVRQAMRAGWTLRDALLVDAITALRPYRGGAEDEPVAQVYARIARAIEVAPVADDPEDDDDEPEAWTPEPARIARALREGLALLAGDRTAKWRALDPLLRDAGDEKVVLFAQPIETVMALARYLEQTYDHAPALIIGNQSDAERTAVVAAFQRASGPQFLVSSRAGGEGLNLQAARRLIHVDVPWNPMELEQRVGRVHRFGARRTILVDTLVVKDSREAVMYEAARNKMRTVASALALDADRFETLFARVMALVPPEELQLVMAADALGPLTSAQHNAIASLVTAGFASWRSFHADYANQRLALLPSGLATWDDVAALAIDGLGAAPAPAGAIQHFSLLDEPAPPDGDAPAPPSTVRGLVLDDVLHGLGDEAGMPIRDARDRPVPSLGLNSPALQRALRDHAFPEAFAGAAHLRWPAELARPIPGPFVVLAIVRMPVRVVDAGYQDLAPTLRLWTGTTELTEVTGDARLALLRGLFATSLRRDAEPAPALIAAADAALPRLLASLRVPSDAERAARIRAAAFPLLAAIVS